jgi:hypothetical protein
MAKALLGKENASATTKGRVEHAQLPLPEEVPHGEA